MTSSGRFRPLPFSRAITFGAVHVRADDLRRDAFLVEHLLDVFGDDVLVAGRVARVEAQHRLVVAHRFFFDLRPVGLRRLLRGERGRRAGERGERRRGTLVGCS